VLAHRSVANPTETVRNRIRLPVAEAEVTNAPATTNRDDLIDRALGSIEWRLTETRRVRLGAGEQLDHAHTGAGFSYVAAGRGSVRLSGTTWLPVEAGDLLVLTRDQRRRLQADETMSTVDVSFARPPVGRHTAIDALPDSLLVRRFAHHEPNMIALIDDMKHGWSPASLRRRGDTVICGRIATTLLSVALRLWAELGCGADRWLQTIEDPRIGQAVDGMHADLTRTWSVDELARLATMSRSAFAARFREVVGRTPASYLTAIRMEAARDLLRTEDVTVTELAYRVGYNSDAGFSRAFQRHTGVAPSRWRAHHPAAVSVA